LGVLQRNAAVFMEHAPGAASSEHPEHVHQMRVATRRPRAALRVFGDVLPLNATSLNVELRWIATELGPVRDLDVQLRRLRDNSQALGVGDALQPYNNWLGDQRERAQTELVAALQAQRYLDLTDRMQRASAWVPDPATDLQLFEDGPRRLRRALKQLRKRADAIDALSALGDYHAVRIRAKRLRYTVEFYAPVYGEPAAQVVESIVALQDLLGDLQDSVVSGQHIHAAIQTSAGAWPSETAVALGQLMQHEVQRGKDVRNAFAQAYADVRGTRWRQLERAALRLRG
jgi:triphosphatase